MIRRGLIVVLAAGLALGCDRLFGPPPLRLSGTLELTEHNLGAPVPGRLASLLVDEGQPVARGQLLATLDRFEQAQRDYRRAVELFAHGGTTQQAVEQAALAMEDQRVVSPVDGVVLVTVHEPGEVLTAGSAVVVVGDRRRLWVRVYVPEGQVSRVRMNQPATVRVDGVARPLDAHVSFIAPQAEFTPRNVQTLEERVTQTFAVKVTLDEPQPSLRPGVWAEVSLPLDSR